MSKRLIPQTAKDLIAARKLIEDPENWCEGDPLDTPGKSCAEQALMIIVLGCDAVWSNNSNQADFEETSAYKVLLKSSMKLFGFLPWQTNDRSGHVGAMKMFDHAIQSEIEKANS